MGKIDDAGRAIAGLLGYNPGPGIYSRLERAVEAMPANVRVEELPGLLKRYKEGVPGWELKETDFPGLVGDAQVIPRQDLLDRVRERSPVFTHREIVLGGNPPVTPIGDRHGNDFRGLIGYPGYWDNAAPVRQTSPSPLGRGIHHGAPRFANYGQGGTDPTEILIIEPGDSARRLEQLAGQPHHYSRNWPGPQMPKPFDAPQEVVDAATDGTVSHMRYDRNGDALRLNEVQSDLHNYNIKAARKGEAPIPFALQDAQKDIQLKRFLLQAARDGTAIEVAAPADIADVVGMPLEHAQHLYGKVYPSDLQRFARPLGGLIDEPIPPSPVYGDMTTAARDALGAVAREARLAVPARANEAYRELYNRMRMDINDPSSMNYYANQLADALGRAGRDPAQEMPSLMHLASRHADAIQAFENAGIAHGTKSYRPPPPGYRARPSDEMRKRILTSGIGASLLAPMAMEGEE